jgi:DNA-binding NtrC family response regulator
MSEEAAVRREAVGMNILIVDDEQTIRETCSVVAEQCGMKACSVATAEQAYEVLEQSAVDILLTDLKLAESSGLELLQKDHDLHPQVAVVVLIPLLVTSFLEKFSGTNGDSRAISEDAMRRLIAYDWPGNVRELENAIERSVALGSGPIVHVADLPSNLQYPSSERAPEKDEVLPLEELERRAILRTLRETNGDKLAAVRILGIGKTTLYRKLKQYNMEHVEA